MVKIKRIRVTTCQTLLMRTGCRPCARRNYRIADSNDQILDQKGSPALDASAVKTIDNEFITSTDYVGAFADNYLWIQS